MKYLIKIVLYINIFFLSPWLANTEIELINDRNELGKVLPGVILEQSLTLKNNGLTTETVKGIQFSCKCFQEHNSTFPLLVPPLSDLKIPFSITTQKNSGHVVESVVITLENARRLHHEVTMDVVDALNPKFLTFGNVVKGGNCDKKYVTAKMPRGLKIDVEKTLSNLPPDLKIHLRSSMLGKYKFEVTLDPEIIKIGQQKRAVKFFVENQNYFLTLPISMNIQGKYSIEPSIVSFGVVPKNTKKTKSVSIWSNNPSIELSITSFDMPSELSGRFGTDEFTKHPKIILTFSSEYASIGKYQSQVIVRLSDGSSVPVKIEAFVAD